MSNLCVYLMLPFVKTWTIFLYVGSWLKEHMLSKGCLLRSNQGVCKAFLGLTFSFHTVVWNLWRSWSFFGGKMEKTKQNPTTTIWIYSYAFTTEHIYGIEAYKMAIFTVHLCWMAWSHSFFLNALWALNPVGVLVSKY